ncbi:DoxX family membrane protein [Paraglaciecola marina]|uniref:DoxX family membrane protein n=1 Tax=Paraglaciecola marina TaxID=2500157 RepID=UPI0010621721|nr:DoxX family membrane protein [Paraglaciecola marina]
MQAISLLLLRVSTGLYLIFWGTVKLAATDKANAVSDKYYNGLLSGDLINLGLGSLQVIIGALVVIGLFRRISYYGQLVWYVMGLLPILPYIIDPFGKYIADSAKLTFFPSTTLLFASLVLIVFKEYDSYSVDAKRNDQ